MKEENEQLGTEQTEQTDRSQSTQPEKGQTKQTGKHRYKLMLVSEQHDNTVFSFSMPLWMTIILAILLIALTAILALIIATETPIRNYLPGYLDMNKRVTVVESAMRVDSLAQESAMREAYLDNMKAILMDRKTSVDSIAPYDSAVVRMADTIMAAGPREQAFDAKYEEQERFGLNALDDNKELSAVSFITPIKGGELVVPEDAAEVDPLAGSKLRLAHEVPVLSPLDGTVISERYLIGNGYEITIQCNNDYTFIFSHLSSSMINEGKVLKAGSVMGHAGAESNAEDRWITIHAWHKGKAVDPQTIFNF